MNTVPAIRIENLHYDVDGVVLLRDVSLSVRKGAFHAIVGPNGAGKSTLLRCLNGILGGWTGSIAVDGTDLSELSHRQIARLVSYVPQTSNGFMAFTVREFIEMSRYSHLRPFAGTSEKDREAVRWSLELVGIESLSERLLPTLSGGERQKVMIAGAFAQNAFGAEPGIMLLDEPTTFLDHRHQGEINAILHRANREHGTTIVAVTHDINAAAITADDVTALKKGAVVFDGRLSDLMTPEVLEHIFDAPFVLVPHPHTKRPMVVPEASSE